MSKNTVTDGDTGNDKAAEASMAIPPIYVLRSAHRCPECGKAVHVYALGSAAFIDAEERHPIEAFHILNFIRRVPERVLRLLAAKCRGYHFDRSDSDEAPYLMNHCPCGAPLDDCALHWDAGGAFCPNTPEGYSTIKLFQLPIDTPVAIECSYSLGGGEYLETEAEQSW